MAYGLTRAPGALRSFLLTLVILPFLASFLVRVYAWFTILKPNGFLDAAGQMLRFDGGQLAILKASWAKQIGIVYSYLPFMVLLLYATLDKIDDRLLEAARNPGASVPWALWKFAVWLSMPGVLAGCLLILIPVIGEFVIPDLVGGSNTTIEEAGADLYVGPTTIFRRITLPLILPSVLIAWALAFVLSFDDRVISSLTTGPGATTLPMRPYSQIR